MNIKRESPCKTCGKNRRRQGSAYCEDCATNHKILQNEEKRRQKRVDEAVQKIEKGV